MTQPSKKSQSAVGPGRPSKGDRVAILNRYPPEVLAGLDARAAREGLSRNDAALAAAVAWGDFPNGKPKLSKEKAAPKAPKSTASKVKTAAPADIKPGSRLDKKSVGARTGPKIAKAPVPQPEETV